ncbi:unnamed protein product [Arctia plantaginis]|uniref:Sulfatase N-terminal domain-containing protein n=1 Tax=Arctia plantaginis TaxID=874455 RepID=A0A8S1A334_ARCPL|nr:unnamed protein product [Arctia plantaginis]
MKTTNILFCIFVFSSTTTCVLRKPNIVLIIADDLGWNDVSLHGSDQIPTPNIDLLALSGVTLGRYYSHAICTPSRSALLTGKYSHKIGMQGYPILMSEDRGIPISEKLLPQYFKDAGYATHLVGKWHVGASRTEYLPTSRGFDSHFGHRGGFMDYYEYTIEETYSPVGTVSGLPLFRNLTPAWDVEGYITDVYTSHATSIIEKHDKTFPLFLVVSHNAAHASNEASILQAPPKDVRKMRHVAMTSRRIFAAVVKKLDDSVGEIIEALYHKGILENTIIVFISDNGGMTTGEYHNYASNYPLRGLKTTPFEGGVRVIGLVWSTSLNNSDHYWDGYMHVSDWMPTLLTAANIDVPSDLDGINHWESITSNTPSKRKTMYEIDDYTGYASIIFGDYKLVTGNVIERYSNYQGSDLREMIGKAPSYTDAILGSTVYNILKLLGRPFSITDLHLRNKTVIECNSTPINICFPADGTVCLYDIKKDPCETTDLSKAYPELMRMIKVLLDTEVARMIPRTLPVFRDPLAAPYLANYTWTTWVSDLKSY